MIACNSCTEYSNYYVKCVTKQIVSLSNSNDTIDEPTDPHALDYDNGSTNNSEDGKLAVIKDATKIDGIDILLLQDTPLLQKDDGLSI